MDTKEEGTKKVRTHEAVVSESQKKDRLISGYFSKAEVQKGIRNDAESRDLLKYDNQSHLDLVNDITN